MIHLTRKTYFSAGHRYANPEWSEEKNREVFGKCFNPGGHGHNYVLEVTVGGDPDPKTGMVINLAVIDKILQAVLEEVDHKNLNLDIAQFQNRNPTTENLAVYLWGRIRERLGDAARLEHLRLYEDENLYVDYTG